MKVPLFMWLLMATTITGIVISIVALTTHDAGANGKNHGECSSGVVSIARTNDDLVTYDASPNIITGVCLKAGNTQRHNQVYRNDGVILSSDGGQKCYVISSIGTPKVTVTREGGGRYCHGLSHIDVLTTPPRECEEETCPTPILIPTATPTVSPTPLPPPTPLPNATPTTTFGPGSPTTPTLTTINQASPTPTSGMLSGFPNTGAGGSDGGAPVWLIVLASLGAGANVAVLAWIILLLFRR